MGKHTIVSIYEVDGLGMTGARVGEGSLIAPRGALIHPPLSNAIADGHGPQKLRVGIRSDTGEGPLVEVIDGREAPQVLGVKDGVGPLVGLQLGAEATSRIDVINGMWEGMTMDDLVELAVPVLASSSTEGWNDPNPPVILPDSRVFCRLLRWLCP
jgi:hypothetical protein